MRASVYTGWYQGQPQAGMTPTVHSDVVAGIQKGNQANTQIQVHMYRYKL